MPAELLDNLKQSDDLQSALKNLLDLLTIYEAQNTNEIDKFKEYKNNFIEIHNNINEDQETVRELFNEEIEKLKQLKSFLDFLAEYKSKQNNQFKKQDDVIFKKQNITHTTKSNSKKYIFAFISVISLFVFIVLVSGFIYFFYPVNEPGSNSIITKEKLVNADNEEKTSAMVNVMSVYPKQKNGMSFFKGKSIRINNKAVAIKGLYVDNNEVSVKEFKEFIDATGYQTDAEKESWSYVYDIERDEFVLKYHIDWRFDTFGNKIIESNMDYPVVHVSLNDAIAYAKWQEKRIPNFNEWCYISGYYDDFVNKDFTDNFYNLFNNDTIYINPVLNKDKLVNIIGNVAEWCINENSKLNSYLCGASTLTHNDSLKDNLIKNYNSDFRNGISGFRCITYAK